MRDVHQVEFNPRELGVNGATFAAAFNSNPFGTEGFNQLKVEFVVTRVAATDLSFYLESLMPDGSTYGPHRYGDVAPADPTVETMYRRQILIPGLATAANCAGQLNFPINSRQMRLGTIIGTLASSDTLLMRVRLGVV